jgi:hypothetical protein
MAKSRIKGFAIRTAYQTCLTAGRLTVIALVEEVVVGRAVSLAADGWYFKAIGVIVVFFYNPTTVMAHLQIVKEHPATLR